MQFVLMVYLSGLEFFCFFFLDLCEDFSELKLLHKSENAQASERKLCWARSVNWDRLFVDEDGSSSSLRHALWPWPSSHWPACSAVLAHLFSFNCCHCLLCPLNEWFIEVSLSLKLWTVRSNFKNYQID